jgi:hypothetical protein
MKVFFILITVVLVSATSNSCKKTCICYTHNPSFREKRDVRTREECMLEISPMDTIYTRCEWE